MSYTPYSISWNLTQRCSLFCAHCYLSAWGKGESAQELSTAECRRIIDDIARVNPQVFLILTGGEPLLRHDLFELAAYATEKRFTVVLGTSGVLLREREARLMRQHGIVGASISLDSTDPHKHDTFRRLPGAWQKAITAMEVLQAEGLDFSIHMTVTDWNVREIPAMIELAREKGARALNFFFLVRTGRGEKLTDISALQYEQILTYLARVQGVGEEKRQPSSPGDPWALPVKRTDTLLIRAKCAPHFRRILWERDPTSPLLKNFAHGSCPAGRYYCRITPTGEVTPCPYMPLPVGNLREASFPELWEQARVFQDLRALKLSGRCGDCEFRKICGGCRCRAYATYGDYLAEDPACAYQPGRYGGTLIDLPPEQTFGQEVSCQLRWDEAARRRLEAIPFFARGMVARAVEAYARSTGQALITPDLLLEVRQKWGGRFRPQGR